MRKIMLEAIKQFFIGGTVKRTDYLYDTPHLITLALVAIATVVMVLIFKNKSAKTKRIVLWVLFGVFLTFEVLARVIGLIKGGDIVKTLVPMHFCSIMVWFIIVSVIVNKKGMYSISALGGLLATSAYLIHPAVGLNVEVINFSAFYSIFSHSLGFVTSVWLLACGFTSYKLKDIWMSIAFAVAVIGYSAILNFVVYPGENYMYYVKNPLPFEIGAWFQVLYVLVLLVYISTFYVTYYFVEKSKAKKSLINNNQPALNSAEETNSQNNNTEETQPKK